jgi:hypothetical protein
MPPYTPVKSEAQRKKLFALANRGELSMDEARGKARAAKGRKLPKRAGRKHRTKRGR